VVASAGTIYDACSADGCGLLATTTEEWIDAMESLIRDGRKRSEQLLKAQKRLKDEYSISKLERQVLDVLDSVRSAEVPTSLGAVGTDASVSPRP
jgi:pyruvate dehydrogenase complex dehydrogenase (E1) component